jgi:hypothetical protein
MCSLEYRMMDEVQKLSNPDIESDFIVTLV